MKSKTLHNLMRLLVTVLGAGIGAALVAFALSMARLADPEMHLQVYELVIAYAGVCAVFAALLFLFSERIIAGIMHIGTAIINHADTIPARKLIPALVGLLFGLILAALLSIVLGQMGNSIFTVTLNVILYIALGVLGYTIGYRRSDDINAYMRSAFRLNGKKLRRTKKKRKEESAQVVKLLDTSALMDGRVADVSENGFLDGVLVVPDFVVESVRKAAESSDPVRRARGQRGMEILDSLKNQRGENFRVEAVHDAQDGVDEDVRLLRLANTLHASVVTCDYSLNRAAQISGLRVLSIDSLANALRPALVTGETVSLVIVKEGKEATQGVGYLPDGTMGVVDGGREKVGQTVRVQVSSVLQTNAGRMIFARMAEQESA